MWIYVNLWIINNAFTAIRVVWVSGGLGKSSNINEVIRSVSFFYKKISPVQKSTEHKKCV